MITKTKNDTFEPWYFIKRSIIGQPWIGNEQLPVTLEGRHELKKKIIQGIINSKVCLKICSFILTDPDIVETLLKKLELTEVAIFVITQLDESKFSTSFLTDEEISENPSQYHLDAISTLYDKGAHVRASDSIHAKFMIVDNEYTLLTSANMTKTSLNENPESGVILGGKLNADAIIVFDLVYRFGTTYNRFVAAGGGKRFVLQNVNVLKPSWLPNSNSDFLFTLSNHRRSIYDEMLEIINNAESDIVLSTYCITGLEKLEEFTNGITNAINRGVKVRVFCRGMNYRPDHLYGSKLLADMGCELYGDLLNHSKGLSSEKESIIFTANLDGRHGLTNGFEVGARLSEEQHKALRSFMFWQIDNAPYEFKHNISREELFSTYEWYSQQRKLKIPKRFDDLTLRAIGLSDRLKINIAEKAFYGVYSNNELIAIEGDGDSLLVEKKGKVLKVKGSNRKNFNSEKYLIRYNKLRIEYE